jgi:hypothetical protein
MFISLYVVLEATTKKRLVKTEITLHVLKLQ